VPPVRSPFDLPTLDALRSLLIAASLLHVELMMPRTLEEWDALSSFAPSPELWSYQRRVWDEQHELPAELPRIIMRIVEAEPEHGMTQS
jgi:hypothetical protein